MPSVVAVVVTHDPDLVRFGLVLDSLVGEVDGVVIVDNASRNINEIMKLCGQVPNCSVIRLLFNSGVAYALMKGVHYAVEKHNPDWLLLLDDDTIIMRNAVRTTLKILEKIPKEIRDKVGIIRLGSVRGDCRVYDARTIAFSGSLIRHDIALRTCCRSDFFLDQADFDLYFRVKKMGFLTLELNCKLIDHKIGNEIYIPLLRRTVSYEPPWRYYYIARNSTILFKERKIHSHIYLGQLLYWGLIVLFHDGFRNS
ncbi:glycosyltransferase [Vulcanisaeta sp. JCM 14467]|uniref:glycosyltransferase n=1 Tax=Vulcanisaeta sp. JCM 14467 TaxID=1295370 RepID=UPI0006D1B4FD|nr:glycosyltransferase [Vulcanisaeta sp. JCM 14467]